MTQDEAIKRVVDLARETGERHTIEFGDGAEAYAYRVTDRIHAGVNDPICVWQGQYDLEGNLLGAHDFKAKAEALARLVAEAK